MKRLKRLLLISLCIILCFMGRTASADSDWPFADVPSDPDYWAHDAIMYVYEKEIIKGYGTDSLGRIKFGPEDKVTRGQLVVMLYRLAGNPGHTNTVSYTDVSREDYFYDAVMWASEEKVVHGYAETNRFGPNDNITRQQLAAMICNYLDQKNAVFSETEYGEFADIEDVADWAYDSVTKMLSSGIIRGEKYQEASGELRLYISPYKTATRAECAAMLQRLLIYLEDYQTCKGKNDINEPEKEDTEEHEHEWKLIDIEEIDEVGHWKEGTVTYREVQKPVMVEHAACRRCGIDLVATYGTDEEGIKRMADHLDACNSQYETRSFETGEYITEIEPDYSEGVWIVDQKECIRYIYRCTICEKEKYEEIEK